MSITVKLGGRTTYYLASTYGEGTTVHLTGYVVKASADPKEAAAAVLAHRTLGDWASAVKRPALVDPRTGEIFPLRPAA